MKIMHCSFDVKPALVGGSFLVITGIVAIALACLFHYHWHFLPPVGNYAGFGWGGLSTTVGLLLLGLALKKSYQKDPSIQASGSSRIKQILKAYTDQSSGVVDSSKALIYVMRQGDFLSMNDLIERYPEAINVSFYNCPAEQKEKNYPLHYMIRFHPDQRGIIEKMIAKGADLNLMDWTNKSLFHTALENTQRDFQVVKMLLPYINTENINLQDCDGNTLLHYFGISYFDERYVPVMKKLLEVGANVSIKNNEGNPPLQNIFAKFVRIEGFGASLPSWPSEDYLLSIVSLLIENGADLSLVRRIIPQDEGFFALEDLAKSNKLFRLEALIERHKKHVPFVPFSPQVF